MSAVSGKVLPVDGDFTALALGEESVEGQQRPMMLRRFSNDTEIKYLRGGVGDTTEIVNSEREDVVSPLPHETPPPSISSHADKLLFQSSLVPKQLPPLTSSASFTTRQPPLLRKTGTVQGLLNAPTKTELRARQRALIERRAIPSKKHSTAERAAYRVDLYISTRRGQTISLAIVGLILMTIGGCILKASQPGQHFSEMVWQSWTFLGDAGSHTTLTEPGLRVLGVVMTLIGILYFSVIMGFVVDGIREKMDSLKKGKSKVAEEGHTLMLGWTDKSISLIRQICLANASEKGGVIVVLAEIEKEDLEAELASHLLVEELRGTKVIFRTGTPLLSVDLLKVAAHRARSIIIMASSNGDADRSDAAVLRTVLSLKTLPELSGHIVAELRDIDNEALVRLVGGDEVEIIVSHDVIGRLVLMAARSPGLARVFSCLLGFEGNEFYFKEWPECVGVKFGELAERFPDAVPLGIKRASGEVLIAPDVDISVQQGDTIMVLAEDDDTYKACPPVHIDAGMLPTALSKSTQKERILMCGWRRDIRDMILLLDSMVVCGTELHMLCEEPVHLRNKILLESGLNVDTLKNLRLVHHYGNTAVRRHLETLPLHTFSSLMILSDESRETDIMHSDSHTLASLLLVRDLQMKMHHSSGAITDALDTSKCICEVLDPRTQRTISTSSSILRLSEFIQSNELISCILAMISESRDVRIILDELLGADGATFEVDPSSRYCSQSESLSFWQLAKRVSSLGEILCGYQMRGAIDETILNPTEKTVARTWSGVDLIILRKKHLPAILRPQTLLPVETNSFERTSLNRRRKSTVARQQILEALVHEQELANMEELNGQERTMLTKAVRSFIENSHDDSTASITEMSGVSPHAVRSLIHVARLLADTLEQFEGLQPRGRSNSDCTDGVDEKVTEFDINSV